MFKRSGIGLILSPLIIVIALAVAPLLLSCSGPAAAPQQSSASQQSSADQAPQSGKKAEDTAKKSGEPVKIRIAYGIPSEEQKYVMQKKPEILKNYGKAYTLEWFQFQGTPPQGQALVADGVDAATLAGTVAAQLAAQSGFPFLITGSMITEYKDKSFSTTWLVRDNSGINSIKDLKGKTAGVNALGASLDQIQREAFKKAGLEPDKDIRIVEISFGLMEDNLRKGNIDVGTFPQPFLINAMKNGGVKPLFKLTDIQPKYVQLINVFSTKFVKEHPDTVKAFIEDWKIASEFMQKNPDETKKIVADMTKIPLAVVNQYLLTKDDYYHDPIGEPDFETLQQNWDWMYDTGQIKKKLSVKDYYDPKFVPSAIK